MSNTLQKALDLIQNAKSLIVNTNGLDGYPNTRIFYSQAVDGFVVYFSTAKGTAKVTEIAANPRVSAFFEDTAQELSTWKNVTVYGTAELLSPDSAAYGRAVELISQNSPNFRRRAQAGELGGTVLFRVEPRRVKLLDYAADPKVVEFQPEHETAH